MAAVAEIFEPSRIDVDTVSSGIFKRNLRRAGHFTHENLKKVLPLDLVEETVRERSLRVPLRFFKASKEEFGTSAFFEVAGRFLFPLQAGTVYFLYRTMGDLPLSSRLEILVAATVAGEVSTYFAEKYALDHGISASLRTLTTYKNSISEKDEKGNFVEKNLGEEEKEGKKRVAIFSSKTLGFLTSFPALINAGAGIMGPSGATEYLIYSQLAGRCVGTPFWLAAHLIAANKDEIKAFGKKAIKEIKEMPENVRAASQRIRKDLAPAVLDSPGKIKDTIAREGVIFQRD
ncbi:MAG: hypothetical protein M1268_04230 [Patescibacteria group bacterium]|nr:hypothetical protein [Patescibacteria group bacterium]